MPPVRLIQAFFDQATTQGSRSTVLRPLGWLIGICVGAVLGAVEFKASGWIVWLFAMFAGLGVVLYLGTFIFCLLTSREDLLRSETYSIQKLAIEKGFVGDNIAGVFQPEAVEPERLLGPGQSADEGEK